MGVVILLLSSMLAAQNTAGDAPPDVVDFFRTVASTLVDADRDLSVAEEVQRPRHASEFLGHFDKSMPGYDQFSAQVEEMVGAGEVATTIDFVNTEGNDRKRRLQLDWLLECEGQRKKRALIQCTIEKRGKKWKITQISPIEFFKRD